MTPWSPSRPTSLIAIVAGGPFREGSRGIPGGRPIRTKTIEARRQGWARSNHRENCTTEQVSDVEIIEPKRGNRGRWLTSGNPGGLTHEHRDLLKLFRDKCPDAANDWRSPRSAISLSSSLRDVPPSV